MKIKGQAQAAYLISERHAQIKFFPAVGRLSFILFNRISDKFVGIFLLIASLILITSYNSPTSTMGKSFPRLESLALPTFVKTIRSPGSKKLDEKLVVITNERVEIPEESLKYSKKILMFATSYDKNCPGCSGTTATGLSTGYGVVAVDPKVIPLGSKLYIPGYGIAIAGDTGGSIKGSKIDLGFDDIKKGWWSSRFVEVFILE